MKGGYDDDPDMRTSRLGVVVTVPLWDRRSGPVGEASAQLARSRHELAAQGVFAGSATGRLPTSNMRSARLR